MMDRFKFRVWSQKYKMYLKDQDYPVGHSIFYISQNGEIIESYDGKNSHDDPDFVVEQCTGLKDRHGNLIYEGDICGNAIYPRSKHFFKKIIYRDGGFGWDAGSHPRDTDFIGFAGHANFKELMKNIEIIGNIHEVK